MRTDLSRRNFVKLTGATTLLGLHHLIAKAGLPYPQGTTKTIRLAVLGGGFGATFHWHDHPNCKITAVTDLLPERRERLKHTYKCDNAYESFEEMIKKEKNVDAVAVFSGMLDHAKHARMAMENGWHVTSACPACYTLEEAHILKETKEKTGMKYMMAESSYYRQPMIFARELFKKGVLGEIFYTECEYYHDRGDLKAVVENKKSRFYNADGSYSWRWGMPPMSYPTHATCYVTGLTGERMTHVSCLGWGKDHPMLKNNYYNNPFWNESALMKTDKGHMCRCNVFGLVAGHGERAQWYGDDATFYMTKGGIHDDILRYRTSDHKGTMYDLPVQKSGDVAVPKYWQDSHMLPKEMRYDSGHGGSAVFLSAEFINALLEDREPEVNLYDALAMTVPGIVAHQSSLKGGEQLKIPSFDK